MLFIMAKLSVILKSECMKALEILPLTGKRKERNDDSVMKEHHLFFNPYLVLTVFPY